MPFAYYRRLTRTQKRIYRESDKTTSIRLVRSEQVHRLVRDVAEALKKEDRWRTEAFCRKLVSALTTSFKVPPVRVAVLAKRPSRSWGELHGLYEPKEHGQLPKITVWMRTAQRQQVVAFRTFLRTLLHELCHHLDYELLNLEDSFHTEGFYKRESSLFHQLVAGLQERR